MPGLSGPTLVVLAFFTGPAFASAVVALRVGRQPRNWSVVGCSLLGTVGVGGQLLLAAGAPAGRAPFVCGTVGAWLWYLGWVRSTHPGALADQTLGVFGLLWIGATVTVTVVLAGTGWPLWWSLALAAVTAAGSVLAATTDRHLRNLGPVVVAFGLPALVGALVGPEILFVTCLVWTVVAVILWLLARREQVRRGGPVRSR